MRRFVQLIEIQITRLETNENPGEFVNGSEILESSFCFLRRLSDEATLVCERFIYASGLRFIETLCALFPLNVELLSNMNGFLRNVAQISSLRSSLYQIDIVSLMQAHLVQMPIEVSFPAATVLIHLIVDQSFEQINLTLCQQIRDSILRWPRQKKSLHVYK